MNAIENLEQIPNNAKVCIYGISKFANLIQLILEENRKDIEIVCFVENSNKSFHKGIKIIPYNKINEIINQIDIILFSINVPFIEGLQSTEKLFVLSPYLLADYMANDFNEIFSMFSLQSSLILVPGKINYNNNLLLSFLKSLDSLLAPGKISYNNDLLITFLKNLEFLKDPLFINSYKKGKETGSWENSDVEYRAYIACWAANRVKSLEGDFVECGVNKGGLALTVASYVDFKNITGKTFYLFDTYSGLSEQHLINSHEKERYDTMWKNHYVECYEEAKNNFKDYDNIKLIRGTIPETLTDVKIEKICYLSIDMNCTLPEIKAAEYFWPKLVSGGIIVLDDYAWEGHETQKTAFDSFAKERNFEILTLPTGQGLIIKP